MLNLVCVICAELFNETDDVYVTQCGHIFHYACLRNWLNSSTTCPQCRKTCTDYNILKVYLESAIETSDNVNLRAQLRTEHLLGATHANRSVQEAVDLYEEVNLNLKRELDKCEMHLEKEIKRRENSEKKVEELKSERIRLREDIFFSEISYKVLQDDLKEEIKRRENREKQVAELERDKLLLKDTIYELKSWKEKASPKLVQSANSVANANLNSSAHVGPLIHKEEVNDRQKKSNTKERNDPGSDAILLGVPKQPNENVKLIFHHLCCTIGCVPPTLKAINRSSQKKKSAPQIILKFGSNLERDEIFKAIANYCKKEKRQLCPQDLGITCASSNKIYMRERLTKRNRSLLEQAFCMKRHKQLSTVYTQSGSVYVKQSARGPSIKIENREMLNAIAARYQETSDEEEEEEEEDDDESDY